MDPRDFEKSSSGRCVRTERGFWAFIPNSLPPEISYDSDLIHLLSRADRLLGELSGAGRQLPNPYLLINPYMRLEAVVSSRIEGTQAGMSDLLFFEADPQEKPPIPDVVEVSNYIKAMSHGLGRLGKLPISGRLVREIHQVLMQGARGEHATPGEFRRSPNWIGPPGCTLNDASFVPPPPDEMRSALTQWEKYLHSGPYEPPLVQCALMHYQFEAIHPFLDGNGRVGRLLIPLYLCSLDHLSQPLLYLSAFFERHRDEYYRRLLNVSQKGDWEEWLRFFLRGVATQAERGVKKTTEILELHAAFRERLGEKRLPQAALRLVDHLFMNPVVSVARLAQQWDMSFPTIQKGVDLLVNRGLLREVTGQQRNRLYVADDIFNVVMSLEEGSRPG